jgi:hypothetical protein
VGVGEFVAGVDRLLSRAHGLFTGADGDEVATGGGAGGSVPAAPAGGSGLGTAVTTAGGVYEQSRAGLAGLNAELGEAAAESGAVAAQGRAGSGAIRDQARTVATATAPMGNTAAGARLIVAAMDQQLAAMQRQIETTSAHNHRLALGLRQVAAGYRGLAPGDARDSPPAAPLDSPTWKPGDQRHMPYIAGPPGRAKAARRWCRGCRCAAAGIRGLFGEHGTGQCHGPPRDGGGICRCLVVAGGICSG